MEYINKTHKIITKNNSICFVINTAGDSDFWWWEISTGTWNNYWKDKNCNYLSGEITEQAANEFINADQCSNCGCSCGNYSSIEDAIKDYLKEI